MVEPTCGGIGKDSVFHLRPQLPNGLKLFWSLSFTACKLGIGLLCFSWKWTAGGGEGTFRMVKAKEGDLRHRSMAVTLSASLCTVPRAVTDMGGT